MGRKPKPAVLRRDLEPGDIVIVGPNQALLAEGTIATFLFYGQAGPPIIEVAGRGRFSVLERCLTVLGRPWAPESEPEPQPDTVPYVPDPVLPETLPPEQSDRLLAWMAQRDQRGATSAPHRAPARRAAIMPLAWETRTEQGEPTLPQQIGKAHWDATGLAAWVERLQPESDHETVAVRQLRDALGEVTYWLQEFQYARETVTA